MKTRLLTLLLSIGLAFNLMPAQAQLTESSSNENAILNASPELKKHYANVFMNAFKNLCIPYIAQPDQLQNQLQNATLLSPELANQLLNNTPGKAWVLEKSKEHGFHFLVTVNNHYYCAIQTMSADPVEVEKLFAEIISTAPENSEFSLLKDETIEQDNGNIAHRQSYTLTNKNSMAVIQFSLRTNSISQRSVPQATIFMLINQI